MLPMDQATTPATSSFREAAEKTCLDPRFGKICTDYFYAKNMRAAISGALEVFSKKSPAVTIPDFTEALLDFKTENPLVHISAIKLVTKLANLAKGPISPKQFKSYMRVIESLGCKGVLMLMLLACVLQSFKQRWTN